MSCTHKFDSLQNIRQLFSPLKLMPKIKKSIPQFLQYAFAPGDEDPEVDEVKAALFFVRQIFSILAGLLAGLFHFQGIMTIGVFLFLSLAFAYSYVFRFKEVDEDKIENTEVYTEGLPVSIGEFLLTWILVHTATL